MAALSGHGMLDAACPGQVFTSPTPDQMMEAAAERGHRRRLPVHRQELRRRRDEFRHGVPRCPKALLQVVTNDDVAVEDSLYTTGRRGVAGTLVVEKIVGAAAEEGLVLEELKALGDRVNRATRSMGVALTSCTVPAAGKPTFEIGDGEMEFGVGIHGEPGRRRDTLKRADDDRRRDLHGHRRRSAARQRKAARCCSSTASAARRRWSSI